jgi:DNA-directed RNA polymerase specialized sigma24 family protein
VLDRVYAAARAAAVDDEAAALATRRALVADPNGAPEALAACLAAGGIYARIPPEDRDAVVLARVLGWKRDRIAAQLGTTPADVTARLSRGLRTLLPPLDSAGAASPAHAGRAS